MDFGMLHHMLQRNPHDSQTSLFKTVVEQTLLAEELGFSTAWFTEHHFSNYGICPSPLMMATYVAARTRTIRVGTGVLVLPLHSPLRLVQEILLADHLSEGRLTVGVGAGFQASEFRAYGITTNEAGARFLECLDILDMGLTSGRVSYQGTYHTITETPFVLNPVQRPRPPIFVAGLTAQREVQRRALERGYVPFIHAGTHPTRAVLEMKERWRDVYKEIAPSTTNMPFAYQRFVYVTDSKSEARDFAERIRYMTRLSTSLRNDYAVLDGAYLQDLPLKNEVDLDVVLQNAIIGDEECCTERLGCELKVLSPLHLSCFFSVAGLEHRRALKSIERFGTVVMPAIKKLLSAEGEIPQATLHLERTSTNRQPAH